MSTATVSHVLNGTRGAKPETRQRVLAAIQELGYSQNQAGRDLARGRSSLLGLIISDIRNPFFPEVTAAFQEQALLNNMDALVLNTNYDAQRTMNSVKRVMGLQVPGVAILTSQIDPAVVDMLADHNIAAVYLDLGRVDRSISNIVLDYEHGIKEALEHLTKLGHRRIAYIGGPLHLHSAQRRKNAFLESAGQMGLEAPATIDADFTVKGGYFACAKLLAGSTPTAIVAGNDLTAIGVLHRAYDGGLRVPDDLSVVGFDGVAPSTWASHQVTTIRQPVRRMAEATLTLLMDRINNPSMPPEKRILAGQLIEGTSARLS